MRGLIGLAVTAILLLVVIVAADAALTTRAEREAATRVAQQLQAATTVDLRGWPVSLRLLTGRPVPQVAVTATGVPIPGRPASLASLEVILDDARLALGDLRDPPEVPVEAARGRFTARVDGAALTALAEAPALLERIEVGADAVRFVVAGGAAIDTEVSAREGAVVFSADVPVLGPVDVPVPLGDLPAGAVVEQARVDGGQLVLEGRVTDLELVPE